MHVYCVKIKLVIVSLKKQNSKHDNFSSDIADSHAAGFASFLSKSLTQHSKVVPATLAIVKRMVDVIKMVPYV